MNSWPWSGFSFSYLSFRFWSANFFRGCALIAEHKMLPARASSSTESSARSLTKSLGLAMPEGREVQITWCILMYDVWIICMIHTHIVIQESRNIYNYIILYIYICIETYCCVFLYSLVMFILPFCRTQKELTCAWTSRHPVTCQPAGWRIGHLGYHVLCSSCQRSVGDPLSEHDWTSQMAKKFHCHGMIVEIPSGYST